MTPEFLKFKSLFDTAAFYQALLALLALIYNGFLRICSIVTQFLFRAKIVLLLNTSPKSKGV
jgi:hypothetical protein